MIDTDLAGGTVRLILTTGDPLLTTVCTPIDPDNPDLAHEMVDLAATLHDCHNQTGFGRGISAPQIGVTKRLTILNLGAGPIAVINPEITWRSEETQWVWDDCLSVPGILAHVERATSISLAYNDHLNRRWVWERLSPDMAELLQHEIDHLNGILMADHTYGPEGIAPMSARAELVDKFRPAPDNEPSGMKLV